MGQQQSRYETNKNSTHSAPPSSDNLTLPVDILFPSHLPSSRRSSDYNIKSSTRSSRSSDPNPIRSASMRIKHNLTHPRLSRSSATHVRSEVFAPLEELPDVKQEPNFRWLLAQAAMKTKYHDIMDDSECEVDRLQMQNELMKMAFNGNYCAPVDHILPGGHVLDVGCGPGFWMLEMSNQFPTTTFHGLDINDKFPLPEDTPSNCVFDIYNVIEGLPFPDNYFDYVHSRFMCFAFTKEQFPLIVKEMVRVTKIGGYVELMECGMTTYRAGPLIAKINEEALSYFISKGADPTIALHLDEFLLSSTTTTTPSSSSFTSRSTSRSASTNPSPSASTVTFAPPPFPILPPNISVPSRPTPSHMTHIVQKYHSFPIGIWGGRLGVLFREDLEDLLNGFRPWLAPPLLKGLEDRDRKFEDVLRAAMRETDECQSFMNFHVCWGKKVVTLGEDTSR